MDELTKELLNEELGTPTIKKRGRGRPPKNGVSAQPNPGFAKQLAYNPDEDTRTVINDPALLPYKIVVTEVSFNIVDNIRPVGAIADNPYAYCTSLDNALLKIARLKSTNKKSFTLKEYIDDYRNIIKGLRDAVKIS